MQSWCALPRRPRCGGGDRGCCHRWWIADGDDRVSAPFRVPGLPAEWISIMPTGAGRRMWGNLNQPNHVATYLAFGLAACLFLGSTRRRYWAPLAAVALALLLGMALTVSRMSWLHLVLVGGVAGLAWSAEERGLAAGFGRACLCSAWPWFISSATGWWPMPTCFGIWTCRSRWTSGCSRVWVCGCSYGSMRGTCSWPIPGSAAAGATMPGTSTCRPTCSAMSKCP